LPVCLGGTGDYIKKGRPLFYKNSTHPNCIYLTATEHVEAHRLLFNEYPECFALKTAWQLMSGTNYIQKNIRSSLAQFNQTYINKKPVINIELGTVYVSIKEAAQMTHLNSSAISKCCKWPTHTAGGYHWSFYSNDFNLDEYIIPISTKYVGAKVRCIETG